MLFAYNMYNIVNNTNSSNKDVIFSLRLRNLLGNK